MKKIILVTVLMFASSSFAAQKVCFWMEKASTSNADWKGQRLVIDVTKNTLKVLEVDEDEVGYLKGSYKADPKMLKGKNGVNYIQFPMYIGEGCYVGLVDEKLTNPAAVGQIKLRCRGEGFSDDVFFCRPDKKQ